MPLTMLAEAASTTVNWGSIITADSFAPMLSGITTVLPVVIPVALSVIAIPIVWKFVKKFIKG